MADTRDLAKFLVTQTIAFTVRNPLQALAISVTISNPTARSLVFGIAKIEAIELATKVQKYSKLITTNVLTPASKATMNQIKTVAKTPAVSIPAAAITAAAVGAAISSATVVNINRESNISSSSPFSNWSPFGGFGFGTVV